MVTSEHIIAMNLGIKPIEMAADEKLWLIVESGLQWVLKNTSLSFSIEDPKELKKLPANVRLFILKYIEIMNLRIGVTSESISNLSQSFDTTDKNTLIWQAAEELLSDVLKSSVRFVSATNKWG